MIKLIVGNKAYSSWSLRGWLAMKQSGLSFTEELVRMGTDDWPERQRQPDLAQSRGKIPILWDGDIAVWESLAIIDYLADKVGRDLFWPADDAARGFARAIASEMHAGFVSLRNECPTNFRRIYRSHTISEEARADVERVVELWGQALSRFAHGGDYLFGRFGAADIMYAPVVSRFATYALPMPDFARDYCRAVLAHPLVAEWMAAAQAEPWTIGKYEFED